MNKIDAIHNFSIREEEYSLALRGEKRLYSHVAGFFQHYFSEKEIQEKQNFHLQTEQGHYLVSVNRVFKQHIYQIDVADHSFALQEYSGTPEKKQFIQYLKKLEKISSVQPPKPQVVQKKSRLRPLDPPHEGFECRRIQFAYSREFSLERQGMKHDVYQVSLNDHLISDEILEAVLDRTAKKIKDKERKGRFLERTKHEWMFHIVDQKKVLLFAFAIPENGNKERVTMCIPITMFYPTTTRLKGNRSDIAYNHWLENDVPKIHLSQ